MNPVIRSVSYGGGVQSTALLVLAAQRRIDFPLFLMANVGADSENPDTLIYVEEVARPFAAEHGIQIEILDRIRRDGTTETLRERLMKPGSRSLPIPVRMSGGAPGTRSCTAEFKIKVIAKRLKELGAHAGKRCTAHRAEDQSDGTCLPAPQFPGRRWHVQSQAPKPHDCNRGPRPDCGSCLPPNQATIGIGISRDEIHRTNARRSDGHERVVYPLVGLGEETGLNLDRLDCMNVIRAAGLPVPPKSSCYFCPFHRPAAWVELRRRQPELFADSVLIERTLNQRRDELGKDHVFLTRFGRPLDEAIALPDSLLPGFDVEDGSCDSGYCFT